MTKSKKTFTICALLTTAVALGGCPSGGGDAGGGGAKTTKTGTGGGTAPPETSPAGGGPAATGWTPRAFPAAGYWFESDHDAWVGKAWDEVELLQYLEERPAALDEGDRYAVFFRRTCDHCEEMFKKDIAPYPDLQAKILAIEVPETKEKMYGDPLWEIPVGVNAVDFIQLPVGCDWIMTTPLVVHVVDGKVECAQEGDHKKCFGLEEDG